MYSLSVWLVSLKITLSCYNFYLALSYLKVSYVLDESRPTNEIIVKDGPTCLTRENFLTLGLNREMDSVVSETFH